MSQIIEALNNLPVDQVLLAAEGDDKKGGGGIVPTFTPALPDALKGITGQVLAWAAGIGVALAVLGQVLGWSMIGIGHSTERSNLATRGKQSVIWSLVGGMGLAVASSLVMLFYNAAKGGGN
ncbi:hypothetical protein [Streptomyces sp. NRRL S-146]|uniref:hypothetical protein n=1 Tax=Streptomyces sp. NRRL S-146 TaxID=1463884 RepID=UPI0004C9247D|nr:hypothetical protein [Streptomyces sp. NRRL S-146]